MKQVSLSSITPGTTIRDKCYSEDGEFLISPGTIITPRHIELLHKRNIFELYIPDENEDSAAANPPKSEKQLQPDKKVKVFPTIPVSESGGKNENDVGREFERLRKERIELLVQSPEAQHLDLSIRRGRPMDRPVGVSLNNIIHHTYHTTRSAQYKEQLRKAHNNFKPVLQEFLQDLLKQTRVDIEPIQKSAEQLTKLFIEDPDIAINLAGTKTRDKNYLYEHMLNVSIYGIAIATAAGYNKQQVITIATGALLHDIGMKLVPREIWNKKEKLNTKEVTEIRKHPLTGIFMLEKIRHLPEPVRYILYQSHERENGSGYPQHRNSRLIHRYAKIIQIADVYDALSSPRTHRKAYSQFEAMEMIIRMTQRGMFSNHFLKSFLSYTSLFPVGSIVELNDHRIARVIHSNERYFHRPVVSIIVNENNNLLDETEIYNIDLSFDEDLSIIKVFSADELGKIDSMRGF